MKTRLIVIVLAALTLLVVLRLRSDGPSISDASGGPAFEVYVEKPRMARPLFGLLPESLFGPELRFDHTTPGAESGSVGPRRLELRADGWDLVIETDGEGQVTSGTRLVFSLELGPELRTLCCRPADPAAGSLHTTARAGSDDLDGRFVVELATCEYAESGKAIDWPPAPLTVQGSFAGLPHGRR